MMSKMFKAASTISWLGLLVLLVISPGNRIHVLLGALYGVLITLTAFIGIVLVAKILKLVRV